MNMIPVLIISVYNSYTVTALRCHQIF